MKLVHDVVAYLEERGIPCAVVGGVALAIHGVARATLDADLLVADRSVLESSFWKAWKASPAPEIRCGDAEDPLAGVVRFERDPEAVDIIVAKGAWEEALLQRRMFVAIENRRLPAVDRADLILLKLYAGGPQDLLDIRLLLAADRGELRDEVERRLTGLPAMIRTAWQKVLATQS